MQSLNIDAARKLASGMGGPPTSGSTPIPMNTPDIINSLLNTNPFFDTPTPLGTTANPLDSLPVTTTSEEDKKVFATLETPSVPKSVVQSVSATKSDLIKASLKVAIQTKRKSSGKEDIDVKSELEVKTRKREEVVVVPELFSLDHSDSQSPYKLTPEDEERRKRRRERNKIAATKCRNKKKEKTCLLVQESECLEDNNVSLKSEISRLQKERQHLLDVLAAHAPKCKQNLNNSSNYNDFHHNNNNYYDQAIQL